MKPSEYEMFVVVEDMYAQLSKLNSFKYPTSVDRIKTALKAFTFSYLDINDEVFWHDIKRINIIRKLKENVVILKPDKGQGVVLINKKDYVNSLEKMFNDQTKFKAIKDDPTLKRIGILQRYINTLFKRDEINEEEKKEMRPIGGNRTRARGLPKIHKGYVQRRAVNK